jgi:hypothetical protein
MIYIYNYIYKNKYLIVNFDIDQKYIKIYKFLIRVNIFTSLKI